MKWNISITESAKWDLQDAADYYFHVLKKKDEALSLVNDTERILSELTEYPYSHQTVSDPILSLWDIRYVQIKNYLAFYIIDEEEKQIYVIHFLNKRRNWKSLLRCGNSFKH